MAVADRQGEFPLDQVLRALHDGVVVVDGNGTIVYANPAYTRILGVPVDKVVGRNMAEVEPNAKVLQVIRSGAPILQQPFRPNRIPVECVVSSTPIYRGDKLIGGVTVFKNSGELVEFYEAYARMKSLAEYYQRELTREQAVPAGFEGVIGKSSSLVQSLVMASKAARTDATILIRGENGVGKDVLAKAIHSSSRRKNQPYIRINCAAIPEALLESELFGYEGGAFTGAQKQGKLGKFELADGGTLFLDEIGDMSPAMQAKLLHASQEKAIEKVGGRRTVQVDVRIIAATNQPLERLMKEGLFREDLFYRLNVFPLHLAPLRERHEDIPLLAEHFVNQFNRSYEKRLGLAPATLKMLCEYDWPGNVRELRNVMERAVIICSEGLITPDVLRLMQAIERPAERGNLRVRGEAPPKADQAPEAAPQERKRPVSGRPIRSRDRQSYLEVLREARGNRSRAMEILGVSRRTFYKDLRELGLLDEI